MRTTYEFPDPEFQSYNNNFLVPGGVFQLKKHIFFPFKMSLSFLFFCSVYFLIHICHFFNNIPQAMILTNPHVRKHVPYRADRSDCVSVNVYILICHCPPSVLSFSHSTCTYVTFESVPRLFLARHLYVPESETVGL